MVGRLKMRPIEELTLHGQFEFRGFLRVQREPSLVAAHYEVQMAALHHRHRISDAQQDRPFEQKGIATSERRVASRLEKQVQ